MRVPPEAGSNDELGPDFLDFVHVLSLNRVECVLVGGYALAVHNVVRATGDIDFLYRRSLENVRRLCDALTEFGAPANVIEVDALMTPDSVTMFGAPPHRIDLLSAISGVTFEEVWKGSTSVVIAGHQLRVIGLKELRANKLASGRKRDADDLRLLDKAKRTTRDQ